MIYINEFFPNPKGTDTPTEFIELYNKSSGEVSLNGWTIKTEKEKTFSLKGYAIPANGYLVLKHTTTKLALRNTDGGLALYDARGMLMDQASFVGSAPEGESFSRMDYGTAEITHFAFVYPTPGAPNKTVNSAIHIEIHPFNVPLNAPLLPIQFFAMMIGTAALLVGLILYTIRSHEDLSKLFLKGHNELWP